MLDIRLEIGRIDHRRCVEALLPPLVEHCAAKEDPNELDRFLARLGPDAAPAACAVLDGMSLDEKDQMFVWLVAVHEQRMRNAANRELSNLLGGPMIRIGCFSAWDRPGSRMTLLASQVAIDYDALRQSPLVTEGVERLGAENGILKGAAKLALQLGARLSPESLEKQSIALLNSRRVKARLTEVLADALRQAGLDVEIEDMSAEAATVIHLPQTLAAPGGAPGDFEKALLQALEQKARELR